MVRHGRHATMPALQRHRRTRRQRLHPLQRHRPHVTLATRRLAAMYIVIGLMLCATAALIAAALIQGRL